MDIKATDEYRWSGIPAAKQDALAFTLGLPWPADEIPPRPTFVQSS